MKVSLDTNIIIHLYKANQEECIFRRFEDVLAHEFIINVELKNHASDEIIKRVEDDIKAGKIKVINREHLKAKEIHNLFDSHVEDNRRIYESSDLGEVYAIALAKTLGLSVLATDDIKEYGPHYSLIHENDCEIIPFAFYELFVLDFLEGITTADSFGKRFEDVVSQMERPMDIKVCLSKFDKRFYISPLSMNEEKWLESWCHERGINYFDRFDELWNRFVC